MKNILQRVNRPVLLCSVAALAIFAATALLTSTSAHAISVPGGAPVPACDKCLSDTLKNRLVGSGKSTKKMVGEDIEKNTYDNLADYFENIWWPRYLAAAQLKAKEEAGIAATDLANQGRLADADTLTRTAEREQNRTAEILDDPLLSEKVLCEVSLDMSNAVLSENARQRHISLSQKAMDSLSGSPNSDGPSSSHGVISFAEDSVAETVEKGTCDPDGNNGANGKPGGFCEGVAGLRNAHSNANSLFGQTAFVEDKGAINTLDNALMYMYRLFPDRFAPVRPELLKKPLTQQTSEVLHKQDAYKATISAFQQPYLKVIAENTPLEGAASEKYIREALKRAGYDEKLSESIMGRSGTVSKAAADKIVNELRQLDPGATLQKGTLQVSNLLRGILVAASHQTAILQDIRFTLRETNMLLGALGSVNTRELYEEVQTKTNRIAGP